MKSEKAQVRSYSSGSEPGTTVSEPLELKIYFGLSVKGVIRSFDLAQIDENDLVSELGPQGVTEVRPIYITRDGKKSVQTQ